MNPAIVTVAFEFHSPWSEVARTPAEACERLTEQIQVHASHAGAWSEEFIRVDDGRVHVAMRPVGATLAEQGSRQIHVEVPVAVNPVDTSVDRAYAALRLQCISPSHQTRWDVVYHGYLSTRDPKDSVIARIPVVVVVPELLAGAASCSA